jgi:hypothetical protein
MILLLQRIVCQCYSSCTLCTGTILVQPAAAGTFDSNVVYSGLTVAVPGLQAAALASDLVSSGLGQAQGGVQLLRLPWLVVEAGQDLKCNRDGEPSPPSNR